MLAAVTLAALLGVAFLALSAPAAEAAFGFKSLGLTFTEEGGAPATQAGSHPFAWTTSLALNTTGSGSEELPDGALKDLRIQLPPGLVGTPSLLPHCSHADFNAQSCPASSEVGAIGLNTSDAEIEGFEFPLYNLEPLPGNAAELAFTAQSVHVIITLRIATRPPYNLIAQITNATQIAAFFGSTLTIRGVPGGVPFLTLPRSCAPAPTIFEADPWDAPGAWVSSAAPEPLQPSGCGNLLFDPTLSAAPTTDAASAPSGLDLTLEAPDEGIVSPTGTAHADLAAATLALPPQMTINPSFAAGLQACTPVELARETPTSAPGEGCPQGAKIGSAEVTTPLLAGPVAGEIFVAAPDGPATVAPGAENPFDTRFALYLVLRDPERGLLLSLPIRIDPDPQSGLLTATLAQIPQLPISRLELHFNSGPRAPLTTPAACGTATIAYTLTPSSGGPPLEGQSPLTTDRSCSDHSFAPTLTAGTTNYAAGTSSPFVLDLGQSAAEPALSGVSLTLPPGLSASFAAVATCPEAATRVAACPLDSRLGYARLALGSGPEPLWVPAAGPDSAVYLAGPYRGAPYSLLIAVPAVAGPYDFGTVIVRAAIRIDPDTAQARVELDPLPQILGGVPLHYRSIRLVLDRPGFIRNPTSCAPAAIVATATSATGATATAGSPFQAADCAALGLHPRVTVRLESGLRRNGHPTIAATLRPRGTDANLSAARLTLPYGVFVDPVRLRQSCTRARFDAHRCPPGAGIGRLEIQSPLLGGPQRASLYMLEGPHRLPDLAATLGGPVPLTLRGHLSAERGRIGASFESLPDVPLSRLSLVLRGGSRGILVNSRDLCAGPHRATLALAGHNGRHRLLRPRLRGACGKRR